MASMIVWVIGIGVSLGTLVLTAASHQHYLHMVVAALVGVIIAVASIGEARATSASPGGDRASVAVSLQHMGYVWAWGALGLVATYASGVLAWREWWQFLIAFALLAGLSLFLAVTLRDDTSSGIVDPMLTKVARGFAAFILAAMIITMAGLLADGKMWRFTTVAGQRHGSQDWAANNIFFFGAMALVIIAANILRITGRKQPSVT